jgi:hypothetical protein
VQGDWSVLNVATVVCVYRSGGDYSPEYVDKLKDGVLSNTSLNPDIVCLTDQPDELVEQISGVEFVGLQRDYPGWWAKLEMFRLVNQKCLYIDLDTIINDNIDDFLTHDYYITMLKDFNDRVDRPASGLVGWNGNFRHILDEFSTDKIRAYTPGVGKLGDQAWIADTLGFRPEYFQTHFPYRVVSRKWASEEQKRKASIVCYHGKPRPHETGWAL